MILQKGTKGTRRADMADVGGTPQPYRAELGVRFRELCRSERGPGGDAPEAK